ncbi:MAG TPA: Mpo1-like protein [Anaeromyxobacteraceae bacterium]|nr:Mpo1-like protein [Anaeromyxobacteraceae bacterium]
MPELSRVGGRHPRLQALFDDYALAHRHPMNRLCHELAIPVIALTIVAALDRISLGTVFGHPVTAALPAWAAAAAWYVFMDPVLGGGVSVLLFCCIPLGRALSPAAIAALAAAAWGVQFLGHFAFEKRQPSFFTNLVQALVGPVYFLAAMADLGRRPSEP